MLNNIRDSIKQKVSQLIPDSLANDILYFVIKEGVFVDGWADSAMDIKRLKEAIELSTEYFL